MPVSNWGTVGAIFENTADGVNWVDTANGVAVDTVIADIDLTDGQHSSYWSCYNLYHGGDLPSNAVITGVEIKVVARADTAGIIQVNGLSLSLNFSPYPSSVFDGDLVLTDGALSDHIAGGDGQEASSWTPALINTYLSSYGSIFFQLTASGGFSAAQVDGLQFRFHYVLVGGSTLLMMGV